MADPRRFRFAIDRGGTFTDICAECPAPGGGIVFRTLKLLSEHPSAYADAAREGIRRILEEHTGQPHPAAGFDASCVEWIRMGTTVATNALLERKGEPCVFVTTRGFGDVLRIGTQSRPRIFDLRLDRPQMLFTEVIEADERIAFCREDVQSRTDLPPRRIVQGTGAERLEVLRPLAEAPLRTALRASFRRGLRGVAITFMHAYVWGEHERRAGEIARELGFRQISLSHETSPTVRLLPRGDTSCVDAYLTPVLMRYLEQFRAGFRCGLAQTRLLFMQSDGGLTAAEQIQGHRSILSGPAGGVVGCARSVFPALKEQPLIAFDMGGTSTDVSRYGGSLDLRHETEIASVRIQSPQLDIVTVAAGGGSRLFYRHGMLHVGPQSASAQPGPACYRNGGPPTLTDANMVLGRLLPHRFPHVFGAQENAAPDLQASQAALRLLLRQVNAERRPGRTAYSVEEIALGFVNTANETMARSIREVSVARGYDVRTHTLVCFGGAGGQHACALARILGMPRIVLHRHAGVLSAYGVGVADVVRDLRKPTAGVRADASLEQLEPLFQELESRGRAELRTEGFSTAEVQCERFLNLRPRGSIHAQMILQQPQVDPRRTFQNWHRREYGFDNPNPLVVDDVRVRLVGHTEPLRLPPLPKANHPAHPAEHTRTWFGEGWCSTAVYLWEDLFAGQTLPGPALIVQPGATLVVEPGCLAEIHADSGVQIHLRTPRRQRSSTEADPLQLSIYNHLFHSIAEQMGRTLQRTAVSPNIKERLDFSCALFDARGGLVANAPHIPVHLGAMGETVQAQLKLHKDRLNEGDVLLTNDPVYGGSHLPDLTVITPVMHRGRIFCFVANRGHHAEIGGITPGSVPPFSRLLVEEGARISSFKLVQRGIFQTQGISDLLTRSSLAEPHRRIPGTRNLADNLADLQAQVAANQRGVVLIQDLIAQHSLREVQAYMRHVQRNAEESVRKMITTFAARMRIRKRKELRATETMDDGSPITVVIRIDPQKRKLEFDFTESAPEGWNNQNAPPAVTTSAVIYVLRTLLGEDLPINAGFLRPLRIVLARNSILSPSAQAAVVAGNVETSSRITDVLLKAFGAVAGAQGTMNNLTFGDDHFGFYETIGGGTGAGPGWHGQDGLHAHMSNTRITDAEILERRYPIRLRSFSIRPNSGGAGRYTGGNGLVREIEFLRKMECAITSNRRVFPPYGLAGGKAGSCGRNLLIRADGRTIFLGPSNQATVNAGDCIRIETPGGGGYGRPRR